MKKFKSILIIFAFAVAIFGAAATEIFASSEEARSLTTYFKSDCSQADGTCTTTDTGNVCKTSYPSGDQLFDQTIGGACTIPLYRPN